jgi:hypothetical protein
MHDLRPEMQKICRDGRGTSGKEKQLKESFLGDVTNLVAIMKYICNMHLLLKMSTSSTRDR